jgi:hypothetical protein
VIDWGSEGGLHVFCAVLAWCRFRFVRFAADERAETTLGMLAECFEVLGGVPGKVLADRMGCLKGGVVANVVVPAPGSRRTTGSCAARILDSVADLRFPLRPGGGDGWLTGCRSRSSTCWFAGCSASRSCSPAGIWTRTLNCWRSGTRTPSCAGTPDGSGTSRPTGYGSPRWHS